MAVWDGIIPPEEQKAYLKSGWGGRVGFGERPALVVVDMNNAFVRPDYPFSSLAALPCAQNIRRLLDAVRDRGVPVIHVTGHQRHNDAEVGRWKATKKRDPVMSQGDGEEIFALLAPRPGETVLRKYHPSAFFGTPLASLLTFHRVDTLIVTGTVTSGCVRATVLDAFSYNFRVIVPEECVSDRGHTSHAVALFEVQMKYGDVLPLAEVLDYVNRHDGVAGTVAV